MNVEDIRSFALSLPGAEESFPFGDDVMVFKTNGKMFLLLPLYAESLRFNVKCNPDYAVELRERYRAVQPAYHMNKKHWNTILVNGELDNQQLKKFIEDSYNLVGKPKRFNSR
jgi:predicted DNA-binding protein (MmcQ/YjbR family)